MEPGLFSFRGFVAEGLRAQGQAAGVLRLLERRGVPMDDAARERITNCTDRALLDTWFDKAFTATTIDEVFADPPQD